MIDIRLDDLDLVRCLRRRDEHVARVLDGALIVVAGDARELLQFTRSRFPSFTSHDLQHSWRIVRRIESILTSDAKADLSSIEIFAFLIAAALHDVGMISTDGTSAEVRRTHHTLSEVFIQSYMAERLSMISEYLPRLAAATGFIALSHGTSWDTMAASDLFKRPQKIADQPLRSNILAILLRLGDLLDLDSDRSCDALRRHGASYFQDSVSTIHHDRHKHVEHFNYDTREIAITVKAHSKEEHSIWDEWFAYIRQDILHANTYVFRDSLQKYHLPTPILEVKQAPGATYDLWPIRFELDDKGRIWDIISKSIYVGHLDFVRELVQNAIDATLMWMYQHEEVSVDIEMPRLWSLEEYRPMVVVLFTDSWMEVIDDGIGMDKEALQTFLFRVAETGFGTTRRTGSKRFPSIAKFGVGFVSCLVRSQSIVITTRRRNVKSEGVGRRVILKPQALDAYSENHKCPEGTKVLLEFRDKLRSVEIGDYLDSTFVFPSVAIAFVDLQRLQTMLSLASRLEIEHEVSLPLEIPERGLWGFAFKTNERIHSLQNAINSAIAKREIDEAPFLNVAEIIPPQAVFSDLPSDPFFVFLDAQFAVTGIARRVPEKTRSAAAMVWIPVRLLLPERGIDWASLHGFLIHKDALSHSVVAFTEIAEEFDNSDFGVTLPEDDWENNDFDDVESTVVDLVDVMRRRKSMYQREGDAPEPAISLNRLSLLSDKIIVSYHDLGEVDMFTRRKDKVSLKGARKGAVYAADESTLASLGERLNNTVYQDGIPIPVKGFWIAPIGACRARCNLTGSARLELNVARNAINEAPALLALWAHEIGRVIQEAIIDQVMKILQDAAYDVEPRMLLTPIKGNNLLFWHTSNVLTSFVDERYGVKKLRK